MKKSISYTILEATAKMEAFCAYQDRCHKEVTTKLKEMKMIPQAVDHIINHLIQHNFLNEERFARSYARGKFRIKKWGKHRIVRELKQREISRFNISAALTEIDAEEYVNTLDSISMKKWNQLSDSNLLIKKKKLANYLIYRGWELNLVYDKVNQFTSH
ncbi:regulatory protein RecX [Ascidiimonas sp. W6]|uniref:regulatory protein RecX n=1 Tax=Ascidiimonas meishanensis TaxID=3128903 RepID=UPI0030EB62E4